MHALAAAIDDKGIFFYANPQVAEAGRKFWRVNLHGNDT